MQPIDHMSTPCAVHTARTRYRRCSVAFAWPRWCQQGVRTGYRQVRGISSHAASATSICAAIQRASMSTFVYLVDPSKISGARYHRVAT